MFTKITTITCNKRKWSKPVALLWIASLAVVTSFSVIPVADAQITPDTSLGAEASKVTPSNVINGVPSDRIDGGAVRGSNLFHSFSQFNVNTGQQVYFANPVGVDNILSRVTGNTPSNILGTLGVLGSANLFLINPNGIVFGPNARLDISGSFVATTANKLMFNNGLEFSATNPQAPPLLTVNLSPGLQYGASAPSTTIINRGNLAVGKDFTLMSDRLDLQGQLQAGGDLTLQAQDTLRIRDTLTTPFLARSEGNLTLQGIQSVDILALNHPTQAPFISGGTLSLISDGQISADAHFVSQGTFQVRSLSGQLANLMSLYDPIISSVGDVDIDGNYSGAALLVESLGNIRFQGNVTITGPDTTFSPSDPDPDLATLASSRALIVRSGVTSLKFAPVTLPITVNSATFQPISNLPAGITLQGNVITRGGPVILAAEIGDIVTQSIDTGVFGISQNGGDVFITAKNGGINFQNGLLISRSISPATSTAGNAGNVTLAATNGDINLRSIIANSSGLAGSGNGGTVNISTVNGNINVKQSINSWSASRTAPAGNAGGVSISATNGSIFLDNFVNAVSESRDSLPGKGGDITLSAINGNIQTRELYAFSGFRNFATTDYPTTTSSQGGDITVSTNGNAIVGSLLVFSNTGQSGNIDIVAAGDIGTDALNTVGITKSGNIRVRSGGTFSNRSSRVLKPGEANPRLQSNLMTSDTFGSGDGGNIDITARSISLTNGAQISASTHSSGKGGNITLRAIEDITFTGELIETISTEILSPGGYIGDEPGTPLGRYIPLESVESSLDQRVRFRSGVFSQTTSDSTGDAGNITIEATKLFVQNAGAMGVTTFGQGIAGNIAAATTDLIKIDSGSIFGGAAAGSQGTSGGSIMLATKTLEAINGGQIRTSTESLGAAGNIMLQVSDRITLAGQQSGILASTDMGSSGQGGNIAINIGMNSNAVLLQDGAKIAVSSLGTGKGGNINIETQELRLSDRSSIEAETASADGGNITLTIPASILMRRNSLISSTAGTAQSSGNGGNITISTPFLVSAPLENNDIKANAFTGSGGKVDVTAQGIFWFVLRSRADLINLLGTSDPSLLDPQRLPTNDITAISQGNPTLNGVVSLNTPDLDPSRGLAVLPIDLVDASRLINQQCSTSRSDKTGEFVVTGRGGLPPAPEEQFRGTSVLTPWGTLNDSTNQAQQLDTQRRAQTQPTIVVSTSEEIVEAQHWIRNAQGKIMLVAQMPAASDRVWITSPCNHNQLPTNTYGAQ